MIDAMKQALELLESDSPAKVHMARGVLRAAIERAEKQKPVAWRYKWPWNDRWHLVEEASEKLAGIAFVEPLYATPFERRPSDSFVAWNNTQCNPLAPAEKQNLSAWEDGYASGVKAEREACARLLEDYHRFGDTRDCAAAIRARGEKK